MRSWSNWGRKSQWKWWGFSVFTLNPKPISKTSAQDNPHYSMYLWYCWISPYPMKQLSPTSTIVVSFLLVKSTVCSRPLEVMDVGLPPLTQMSSVQKPVGWFKKKRGYPILFICIYLYIFNIYIYTVYGIITVAEVGNPFLTKQYKGTTEWFEHCSGNYGRWG